MNSKLARGLGGGAVGVLAGTVGFVIGLVLVLAYVIVAETFGRTSRPFPTTSPGDLVIWGLGALSLLLIAIAVLITLGLAYVTARLLKADELVAAVISGLLILTFVAYPALPLLSTVNACEIGHSFPLPGRSSTDRVAGFPTRCER